MSGISIGPVYRKDVMRASIMLEKRPEYAVILAFDVRVAPEADKLAAELGVTIFTADIIYHLYDKMTAYINKVKEDRRTATADVAVFPVVLDILPGQPHTRTKRSLSHRLEWDCRRRQAGRATSIILTRAAVAVSCCAVSVWKEWCS